MSTSKPRRRFTLQRPDRNRLQWPPARSDVGAIVCFIFAGVILAMDHPLIACLPLFFGVLALLYPSSATPAELGADPQRGLRVTTPVPAPVDTPSAVVEETTEPEGRP